MTAILVDTDGCTRAQDPRAGGRAARDGGARTHGRCLSLEGVTMAMAMVMAGITVAGRTRAHTLEGAIGAGGDIGRGIGGGGRGPLRLPHPVHLRARAAIDGTNGGKTSKGGGVAGVRVETKTGRRRRGARRKRRCVCFGSSDTFVSNHACYTEAQEWCCRPPPMGKVRNHQRIRVRHIALCLSLPF